MTEEFDFTNIIEFQDLLSNLNEYNLNEIENYILTNFDISNNDMLPSDVLRLSEPLTLPKSNCIISRLSALLPLNSIS